MAGRRDIGAARGLGYARCTRAIRCWGAGLDAGVGEARVRTGWLGRAQCGAQLHVCGAHSGWSGTAMVGDQLEQMADNEQCAQKKKRKRSEGRMEI